MSQTKNLLFSAFVSLAVTQGAPFAEAQQTVINGFNVYSPNLVFQGNKLKMYFGGWMKSGETEDAIYRADCSSPTNCTNPVKAIDPSLPHLRGYLQQVNDPTVVLHPSGQFYIMYMTGVYRGSPLDGFTPAKNHIFYSTSWANDGVNWSAPQLLIREAWLPSATINKNGEILLYANSNVSGLVEQYNLGTSGVQVRTPNIVRTNNGIYYLNVDVMFRPTLGKNGLYQIFAERFPEEGKSNQIDYFTSADGINWSIGRNAVAVPVAGDKHVNTPAPHPHTHGYLYFGSTHQTNSTDYQIYFKTW